MSKKKKDVKKGSKPAQAPTKKNETPKAKVEEKAPPKNPPEKPSEPKIVDVPDACDAVKEGFKTKGKVGFYDGNSSDCKACEKDYPNAAKACKHNTEVEKSLVMKRKETKKRELGERTPLGGLVTSGAGKMELLLLRKGGATMEEMKECRGAVGSHINSLRLKGVNIVRNGLNYYANPSKELLASFEKAPEKKAPEKKEGKKKKK